MTVRSFALLLPLVLAVAGCASAPAEPASTSDERAAVEPVDLPRLEGTWIRDDGKRYSWTFDGERLVGPSLVEEGDLGCQVELAAGEEEGSLEGLATFTLPDEQTPLLQTAWRLKASSPDRIEGQVEGVDLDDDDREVSRSWEDHTFRREDVSTLPASATTEADDEPEAATTKMNNEPEAATTQADDEPDAATTVGDQPEAEASEAAFELEADPDSEAPVGEPDMEGFMASFTGECAGVEAALDTYGVADLERQEMDWYDMSNPRVVSQESRDGLEWFTLEADAGITIRTYELAWRGSQIVEVVPRGLR